LTIVQPDGNTVKESDSSVSYLIVTGTTIVTLSKPLAGTWKVTLSAGVSKTDLSLSVFGTSTLTFNYFRFVEMRGSAHFGLYPLSNDTLVGHTYIATAQLEGDLKTTHFELRAQETGALLERFDLTRGTGDVDSAPTNLWYGNVTVPCGLLVRTAPVLLISDNTPLC
jgi:hypothetical protein